MPIGVYFGKKQLGAKAKSDVEKMVKHMIEIYKKKIAKKHLIESKYNR